MTTLKNLPKFFFWLFVGISMNILQSCEEESHHISLPDNSNKDFVGKYVVNDIMSDYVSFEFMPNGTYIITMIDPEYSEYEAIATRNRRFKIVILYGNYRVGVVANSDNQRPQTTDNGTPIVYTAYNCSNFGTVYRGVAASGSNRIVTGIYVAKENEKEVSLDVTEEEEYESSNATEQLCGNWEFVSMEVKEYEYDELTLHSKYTVGTPKFDIFIGGDEYEQQEELNHYINHGPQKAIFSKYGTYVVVNTDGSLMARKWEWKDESKLEMYYSRVETDFDDEHNYVTLNFTGNELKVKETHKTDEYFRESITTLKAIDDTSDLSTSVAGSSWNIYHTAYYDENGNVDFESEKQWQVHFHTDGSYSDSENGKGSWTQNGNKITARIKYRNDESIIEMTIVNFKSKESAVIEIPCQCSDVNEEGEGLYGWHSRHLLWATYIK